MDAAADYLGVRQGLLGEAMGRFPVQFPNDWDPSNGKGRYFNDTYSQRLSDRAATGGRNGDRSPIWKRDSTNYQQLHNTAVVLQQVITSIRFSTVQLVGSGAVDFQSEALLLLEQTLEPLADLYLSAVDHVDVIRMRVDETVEAAAELEQVLEANPHDHYGGRARALLQQQRKDQMAALAKERARSAANADHTRYTRRDRGGKGGSSTSQGRNGGNGGRSGGSASGNGGGARGTGGASPDSRKGSGGRQ
jgi:uncharacterized membrane protein YgcG